MRTAILLGVAIALLIATDAIFNDGRLAQSVQQSFGHFMTKGL